MADMSQLLILSGSVFIWSLPAVMSPGPVLIATVAGSVKNGARTGPMITLGHALVEVPMILALALGVGLLMEGVGLQAAVGLLGGGFLFVMSLDFLRFARKASLDTSADERSVSLLRAGPILAGALTSISSPFFPIWWIGAGSALTMEALRIAGWLGILIFIPSHLAADLIWYSGIAITVGRGTRVMNDRVFKVILAGCGLFLLYKSLEYITWGYTTLTSLL